MTEDTIHFIYEPQGVTAETTECGLDAKPQQEPFITLNVTSASSLVTCSKCKMLRTSRLIYQGWRGADEDEKETYIENFSEDFDSIEGLCLMLEERHNRIITLEEELNNVHDDLQNAKDDLAKELRA